MKIPIEELERRNVSTNHLDDEIGTYQTYLIVTDYICNKIIEGAATKEDYPEEMKYRQIAREEIARLRSEI